MWLPTSPRWPPRDRGSSSLRYAGRHGTALQRGSNASPRKPREMIFTFLNFYPWERTLGPATVSEETSTRSGTSPRAAHGGKCRTGHEARRKRRLRCGTMRWYTGLRARHETRPSKDISRHAEGGVSRCHQAAHCADCYRERRVGAAVRALPTDANMVDSRAHRCIADYSVDLSRDRVQADGVARGSHDRL